MAVNPTYPGVYVQEVSSPIKPIVGVSTSTAAFIGIVPQVLSLFQTTGATSQNASSPPTQSFKVPTPYYTPVLITNWTEFTQLFAGRVAEETPYPPQASSPTGSPGGTTGSPGGTTGSLGGTTGTPGSPTGSPGSPTGSTKLATRNTRVLAIAPTYGQLTRRIRSTVLDTTRDSSQPAIAPDYQQFLYLANAVYGFFNNGGTRCYVASIQPTQGSQGNTTLDITGLETTLEALQRIDEISLVLLPGGYNDAIRDALVEHCHIKTGDRFAILDAKGPDIVPYQNLTQTLTQTTASGGIMPKTTDYAAWYYPWIKVYDPAAAFVNLNNENGLMAVPPSGHMAGIYARVDNNRGVFKAPANEPILGALNVTQLLSNSDQAGLNPVGVNCIRVLNNNILVWGARTVGGDENYDLKYINVRRTLLYLEKSIHQGTQWAVFEPNDQRLWQKITRNVSAFLTEFWRTGGLFGTTVQEAFYIKCDEETNPPDIRELGQVVTEIGVAIVRPAEFVVFYVSQMAPATPAQ
ncbi:MAG TPA: phage tail sheath subtilisin-like domain-containing protein [Allocoleopsis sp.]